MRFIYMPVKAGVVYPGSDGVTGKLEQNAAIGYPNWDPSTEDWTADDIWFDLARLDDNRWYWDWADEFGTDGHFYMFTAKVTADPAYPIVQETVQFTSVPVTAADVMAEGQFQLVYFPNCASQAILDTFLEERIADADSQVRLELGANYDDASVHVQRLIKRMVLFGTMVDCWQIIKNVMDSYDAEALPPEFVEPDQAAANRDYYLGRLERLLAKYDITPGGKHYVGAWTSGGVDEDEETVLGVNY